MNEVYNNIAEARKRMEWAWVNGWMPICPHLNSAFIDGLVPDKEILRAYIRLVGMCSAILLIKGWRSSSGSKDELAHAIQCGLEIIKDPLG